MHDPDSPSQRIGGEPISGFATVEHALPMMSIDNTYSLEDLEAWHQKIVKGLAAANDSSFEDGSPTFVCDPKVDGVAANLRYESGRLVRVVTRGEEVEGMRIDMRASMAG
jgi:DNA ligase (NAD+)